MPRALIRAPAETSNLEAFLWERMKPNHLSWERMKELILRNYWFYWYSYIVTYFGTSRTQIICFICTVTQFRASGAQSV